MGFAQQRQRVGTPRRRRPLSKGYDFPNTNYVVSLNSPIAAPDKK
jgi:hypothetical protein